MKTNFTHLGARPVRLWPLVVFVACDLLAGHAQAKRAQRHKPRRGTKPVVAADAVSSKLDSGHPPASAVLPENPRVVLLRLNGLGLSEGIRRNLEALVLSHLRQMPHKQIVEPDALRQKLAEPAFADLERCNEGLECLRQRGLAVSADIVVYGTISALGNDYSLNLRALKVADGQELGRQVATLSGNLDQLIPQMRLVTFALLAPDAIWGSLMIDTALSGIEVQVDGVKQAVTPWDAPLEHLKPGRHIVKLDGFTSTHSEVAVDIVPFETSQVQVELGRGPVAAMKSAAQAPSAALSPNRVIETARPGAATPAHETQVAPKNPQTP